MYHIYFKDILDTKKYIKNKNLKGPLLAKYQEGYQVPSTKMVFASKTAIQQVIMLHRASKATISHSVKALAVKSIPGHNML